MSVALPAGEAPPDPVAELSRAALEEAFHDVTLARAEAYARDGQVHALAVTPTTPVAVQVTAQVRGTQLAPYRVTVDVLRRGRNRFDLSSQCSCPVGFLCKHAAAVLLALRPDLRAPGTAPARGAGNGVRLAALGRNPQPPAAAEPAGEAGLHVHHEAWLERLRAALQVERRAGAPGSLRGPAADPQRRRLMYQLAVAGGGGPARLLVLVNFVKLNGAPGRLEALRGDVPALLAAAPAYVQEDDLDLLRRLVALAGSARTGFELTHAPAGLMRELIATGRLIAGADPERPLGPGAPRRAAGRWIPHTTGTQHFVLAAAPAALAFAAPLPWYLDADAAECGPLETELPAVIAAHLLLAPPVAAAEACALAARLETLLGEVAPGVSVPLPRPIEHRSVRGKGQVQLRLAALAGLRAPPPFDDAPGAVLLASIVIDGERAPLYPAAFEHAHEDRVVRVVPDDAQVRRALATLGQRGVIASRLPEVTAVARPGELPMTIDPARAIEIVSEAVPAWREAGWQVTVEPDFPWQIVAFTDIELAVRAAAGSAAGSAARAVAADTDAVPSEAEAARAPGPAADRGAPGAAASGDGALPRPLGGAPRGGAAAGGRARAAGPRHAAAPRDDGLTLEPRLQLADSSVPMLPILESLLQVPEVVKRIGDPGANQDFRIVARVDATRVVLLPWLRVRAILETLVELHDRGQRAAPGETALRLATFDAPIVARLADAGVGRWQGDAGLRELANRLAGFSGVEPVAPPAGLRAELRPYQRDGLAWLQFLSRHGLSGLLADDMGLGKTVQTLAHLLAEREHGRLGQPALIVAPTSLVHNWVAEANRFAPALRTLKLHGAQRHGELDRLGEVDVVVTSYALLPRDIDELRQHAFSVLVLDEAQAVKNARTLAAQAIRALACRQRIALTGTPIENDLDELWAQFDFLAPGLLGDNRHFIRNWRTPIEKKHDASRAARLAARVRPFMLRRTKESVAPELPARTEIERAVELEGAQRELYETVRASMEARVRAALAAQGLAKSHLIVLDALLKLRQVCCDPRLVDLAAARKVRQSAKFDALFELLGTLQAEGRRILLFSQFTSMLDLIQERLKRERTPYALLTGQTRERERQVARFQKGEVPLFLLSLKAGGTGLNLTAADTVIHYDPWWNPATEQQATDRAHRIGQDKPVFVYRLIAAGTVEERIRAMQARKAQLAQALLDDADEGLARALTAEDMAELFAPVVDG